jgi:hypothetical protein
MFIVIPALVLIVLTLLLNIHRHRLSMKYSNFWVVFCILSILPALFPAKVGSILASAGFDLASNGILVISIVFLAFIVLNQSIELSVLEKKMENLIIAIGIREALEKKHNDKN